MDEIQHSRIYNSLDSNDYLRWKINKKDLICSAKCRAWTNSREGIQPASFIAEYLRVDENRVPTVDHVGWRPSFFTCFHCGAEATSEETYEEEKKFKIIRLTQEMEGHLRKAALKEQQIKELKKRPKKASEEEE
jgi:hypothetical protein|tara:strand:+ start:381 stop:782 length:402 start_codon:yes stop_codon:yes gene_type:complete